LEIEIKKRANLGRFRGGFEPGHPVRSFIRKK